MAIATLLRVLWLGSTSLWIDELFSVAWSQRSPGYLLGPGAQIETNPPGYYLLLHGWMQYFGSTEVALRALSVLASVATIPVVYALGRSLFDRRAGWLAAALMAINPVAITYAQQARSYALVSLADALALLALAGYFSSERKAPGCIGEAESHRSRRWAWLGLFTASGIATCWLHYTSLLFVAGCFLVVALILLRERPFPRQALGTWCAAASLVVIGVGWLVWLAAHLSGSDNLVWVPPLTAESVLDFFLDLMIPARRTPEMMPVILGVGGLMILIVAAAGRRLRLGPVATGVLLQIPALYCALLIGASALRPMLLSRTASWLVIPLCVLLARGTLAWSDRWRPFVGAVPVLAFLACTVQGFSYPYSEDWRDAAKLIATDGRCQGPVLIGDFNALGFHYYRLPVGRPAYVFLPDSRRHKAVEFILSQHLMHLPELPLDALPGFIEHHPGTAVVYRWEYDDFIAASLHALLAHAALRDPLPGGLRLVCF